jgi:hypothetical protein
MVLSDYEVAKCSTAMARHKSATTTTPIAPTTPAAPSSSSAPEAMPPGGLAVPYESGH